MPELPEVETVRRGLEKLIVGQRFIDAVSDNAKSFPNDRIQVEQFLFGAEVVRVRRRAKVLLIDLSTSYTLVIHLKMTGQLVFVGDKRFGAGHPSDSLLGHLPDKSTRVTLTFSDGSRLFFNDQRKFGWMRLMPTIEVPQIDFMKRVGPEPLEKDFTKELFSDRLKHRAGSTVKSAILDQSVLAGVGNIYADESLWSARIHPAERVRYIAKSRLDVLHDEIVAVLRLAIEKGGSTDRNYVNAEGKRGSYIEFANVFRREGLACPRHPDIMIEKIRVAGRGTHVCRVCQPAPKVVKANNK